MNLFPGGSQYAGLHKIDFGFRNNDKILDVGSGNKPFPSATHLIDFPDVVAQRHGQPLVIGDREFISGDVCIALLNFPDDYFDFCYSSHTFEHIENLPLALDLINAKCKRGFYALPGSDFEFFTALEHYGHVNLCRQIGDTLHLTKRPSNTVIERFGRLYEKMAEANMDGFHEMWEEEYRFIWEIRHYWEDQIKYKDYEQPEELFPQIKYF